MQPGPTHCGGDRLAERERPACGDALNAVPGRSRHEVLIAPAMGGIASPLGGYNAQARGWGG
ncbi:hypothetical protein [Ktedonobacter robiniae]|uniref:hypothetical protein n=1 Tax=Ktedonobacter robiniae TaxID=2778365 RepID=UPI001F402E4E|nr:hypothetical protein [Ktedonobacter robiniae]